MKKIILLLFIAFAVHSCKKNEKIPLESSETSEALLDTTGPDVDTIKYFREFKITDSKFIDEKAKWKPFEDALFQFSVSRYDSLKPLILEKNIPALQKQISENYFTYEELVLFYLYRIREYDRNNPKSLNAIISLNPDALKTAKILDGSEERIDEYSIFGMPILLKDNINTKELPTTAGALVLQNNLTDDAFIVDRLREKGAIILGKTNLSEWAYFFCGDCPSGYSAMGGQTFNPYGRKTIDTGGSSSGSGVAVAANFCVAAVGTETSGSILSPSSQNSTVGLKPTVGLLSRSGIVPISNTLDTPGPIAKSTVDTAILLQSMVGIDPKDNASSDSPEVKEFYIDLLSSASVKGKRFGAIKELKKDSLYLKALRALASQGAEIIEIDPPKETLSNFTRLLNLDMKKDLPAYFSIYADKTLKAQSVEDVIAYNKKDSVKTAPYGQSLFKGIVEDESSKAELQAIKDTLFKKGQLFFDTPISKYQLDAILSINDVHAGYAAVARYPAITVPMGYAKNGEPEGLTFITTPFSEEKLLQWAYVYENISRMRKFPDNYR